jgi:uncharacterized membrane protein
LVCLITLLIGIVAGVVAAAATATLDWVKRRYLQDKL